MKEFNIYCKFSKNIVGTVTLKPNGLHIVIEGSFMGIYDTFNQWNLQAGLGYFCLELT